MFTVGNVDRYIDHYIGRRRDWHSIDTRSALGCHSVDCRSPVDRHLIATPSIIDQQSVDIYVGWHIFSGHRYLGDTSPTLRRHFADTWPTLHRYLTDTLPIPDRYLTDTRHNQPTHYWRSCDLKWVLIKTNTFCFAHRISSLKCRTFWRRLRK